MHVRQRSQQITSTVKTTTTMILMLRGHGCTSGDQFQTCKASSVKWRWDHEDNSEVDFPDCTVIS